MEINILLVEDDPVWRNMLVSFINNEPDMRVVQSVESKADAIHFCSQHSVEIILMDLNLSANHLDGILATVELSVMGIDTKIIMLTSYYDEQVIRDAFTAGAIHCLIKSDFRKIPEIIRGLANTNSPQEVLVKDYMRMKELEQTSKLTTAEKNVLALLEKGESRTQITEKLVISESTLKNQITQILKKFKAKTSKEVITIIKRRGL